VTKPPPSAPGWPEILVGAVAYLLALLVVALTLPRVEDPAAAGIIGLFVSGAMGLLAFAVAVGIRSRRLTAFGVRPATPRQVVVGALLGLASYVLGTLLVVLYVVTTGAAVQNVQTSYQAAAAGGWVSLALALIAGAVVTPLGEEALFRGVLANALLMRYRAWVAVIVSAAVFAVAHGINPVLPIAFVVGLFTALLFRWSGSIWPGVALHGVNNATALLVPLIIGIVTG
jgi:membrane protease YdiL (CAAX protease family)